MKAFEYAAPKREEDVVSLLSAQPGHTVVLAGGTDLVPLMKQMIVTPQRVVNIKEVRSLRGVRSGSLGISIGAVTTLDDLLECPELDAFPAVLQAVRGISSLQLQAQGTLGGELFQRPRCWYFRNGYGLMSDGGRLAAEGDNRHHAILDNLGPAKFVHASRIAPALIALGAQARIVGPGPSDETVVSLESLYRTPRSDQEQEHTLASNQLVTHLLLPAEAAQWQNATYEVRQGEGPDYPLTAAAAALRMEAGRVAEARIVLGHVAPTPWVSVAAAQSLVGKSINGNSAQAAGEAAVAAATPLSGNAYKVQLAKVSVQRAVLLAAGLDHGGF